jgi:uncharacterized membrane protein AbrB (regulator of aidB expression)
VSDKSGEGARRRWLRLAGTIALGGLGGALAAWAGLPLAWMIGAMLATTAGAMAGLPLAVPPVLRSLFVVVLGVMLGSSFTPAILDRLGEWAVPPTLRPCPAAFRRWCLSAPPWVATCASSP